MPSLPVAFAEVFAGGWLLHRGVAAVQGSLAGGQSGSGAASPGSTAAPTGNLGQVTDSQLAAIAQKHGWDALQVAAWKQVIQQESGGNPKIVNSSSGAAGIAQFINGFGEYAQYGGSADSVTGQLTAMANYIAQRYGNPSAAWSHEQTANWY